MKKMRFIIADDHKIFAEGLKRLIEPEYEVVAVVHDGDELVSAALELRPDVILADISMPGQTGIQAAKKIIDSGLDVKIIMLTMHENVAYATTALDDGVDGFILKHAAPSELLVAIAEVLRGNTVISPKIATAVFMNRNSRRSAQLHTGALDAKQREILRLLATGKTAKEIAAGLRISRKTVEYHKFRMRHILNVQSTAELIQYAIRHGLAPD